MEVSGKVKTYLLRHIESGEYTVAVCDMSAFDEKMVLVGMQELTSTFDVVDGFNFNDVMIDKLNSDREIHIRKATEKTNQLNDDLQKFMDKKRESDNASS